MRTADLFGTAVRDPSGRVVAHVHDIRARVDIQPPDSRGPVLRVEGLIVGSGVIAARAGYAHGGVRGPWVLARFMRWLGRRAHYVAWPLISELTPDHIVIDVELDQLPHPDELREDE